MDEGNLRHRKHHQTEGHDGTEWYRPCPAILAIQYFVHLLITRSQTSDAHQVIRCLPKLPPCILANVTVRQDYK
jgi:hypothetical protein